MTSPWTPMGTGNGREGHLYPDRTQEHLLLIRIHAIARKVVTKHCPDGWKRSEGREPMPNDGLQMSVVDLSDTNEDGTYGKLYPDALLITGTLVAQLKKEVGNTKLIMWKQKPEPRDNYGNPRQTNPYDILDMSANEQANAAASKYLAANPGFMEIPVPAPYESRPMDLTPPPPPQQPYGQQPGYGYQQGPPPQQPSWQAPQQYPPAQPGYGGPPPQQQPPWQAPQPGYQQQPPAPPQQQPAAWNTAAPPPGYYGQQGPPAQQQPAGPPQQPNTFYTAAQNHHGQPQSEVPPW